MIDAGDYDVWKTNFGTTGGSGAAAVTLVPEPNAIFFGLHCGGSPRPPPAFQSSPIVASTAHVRAPRVQCLPAYVAPFEAIGRLVHWIFMAQSLEEQVLSRSALVGIVGLGYVGLPLARVFVDAGFRVLGFDADAAKIEEL